MTETDIHERLDALEDRVESLSDQLDQRDGLVKQFASGAISRRTFLTLATAIGIGSGAVGSAMADSRSPSWGSATGVIGEEGQPLDRGYIRDLHSDQAYINGNELYIQGSSPSSPDTGDIWIDNDG